MLIFIQLLFIEWICQTSPTHTWNRGAFTYINSILKTSCKLDSVPCYSWKKLSKEFLDNFSQSHCSYWQTWDATQGFQAANAMSQAPHHSASKHTFLFWLVTPRTLAWKAGIPPPPPTQWAGLWPRGQREGDLSESPRDPAVCPPLSPDNWLSKGSPPGHFQPPDLPTLKQDHQKCRFTMLSYGNGIIESLLPFKKVCVGGGSWGEQAIGSTCLPAPTCNCWSLSAVHFCDHLPFPILPWELASAIFNE